MKKITVLLLAICCCAILFACQKPCEHQYQEAITTEAGCAAVGVKTFTCTLCQDSYTEQIAAIGHNFGGASITKKATCIEEGEKTHTCTRCGITEVVETLPMSNHKYSSKTTPRIWSFSVSKRSFDSNARSVLIRKCSIVRCSFLQYFFPYFSQKKPIYVLT